ncbi:nuclear transport factor 2 family protein [Pseudalkalibacillus salsuginis]|uniref:nuclear transport factor 2 family protein n=1 Tax=Pseudalkalibacillus salsuginis TaxID=2910972 RepID=UPI001F42CF8E|nr:nuclear transport factor 2 family protein [Pseudalkalibacillus salsuginis]MCF6410356.1 nuclear transport factor 2 family protein [Pseudalkalibacillus salsuginis]
MSNLRVEHAKSWFHDVFGSGDLDRLDEIAIAEVKIETAGRHLVGKQEFIGFLEWYRSTFTDSQWELHDIITGDGKVVIRYTGTSIYAGGWLDLPAREEPVKETGVLIFAYNRDLISKVWCELSDLEVYSDLGGLAHMKNAES